MPLWCQDCKAVYRPLGHPDEHSAPRPQNCEVPACDMDGFTTVSVLRTVSLAAFGDEDRALRVCGRHFDQWALGIREKAVPTWVVHMLRERIR